MICKPIPFFIRNALMAVFAIVASLQPLIAAAQPWPQKPIRIVAPVPPGGGVDILSRAIAQKLQVTFDVPVLVENRAGASALVGTDFVAKSTADGNTLLMGYSVLATNKFLVKNLLTTWNEI